MLLYKYVDSGLFGTVEPLLISSLRPCRSGGGVPCCRLNFKTFPVGVYKCLSLIDSFVVTVTIWPREVVSCRDFILLAVATFWAMSLVGIYPSSLSQFGRGRLSLVVISFYSVSLLFGLCRLSEFTLAGPPPWPLFWPSKMAIHFLIKKPLIANTVTYQYGQQPHFKIRNSRIFSNYTPLIRPLVQNFKN